MKKMFYIPGVGLLATAVIVLASLFNILAQKAGITPGTQARITPVSTVMPEFVQTDFPTFVPSDVINNPPAEFYGEWKNARVNPNIRRVLIQSEDGQTFINMFGVCVPTECNWKEFSPTPTLNYNYVAESKTLSVRWTFVFMQATQEILLTPDGQLKITSQYHYLDDSGRADYQTVEYFKRL